MQVYLFDLTLPHKSLYYFLSIPFLCIITAYYILFLIFLSTIYIFCVVFLIPDNCTNNNSTRSWIAFSYHFHYQQRKPTFLKIKIRKFIKTIILSKSVSHFLIHFCIWIRLLGCAKKENWNFSKAAGAESLQIQVVSNVQLKERVPVHHHCIFY